MNILPAVVKAGANEVANSATNKLATEVVSNAIAKNLATDVITKNVGKSVGKTISKKASDVVAKTASGGAGGKIPTSKAVASASENFGDMAKKLGLAKNILNNEATTELPRSQAITIGANLPKLIENFGADEHGSFSDTYITGMNLKDLMRYADDDILSRGVGFGSGDSFTPYGAGTTAEDWKNWQDTKGILNNSSEQEILDNYWGPVNENIYEEGRLGEFNGYDTPFDEYVSNIDKNAISKTTKFPSEIEMADEYDLADRFLEELINNPDGNARDILEQIIVGAKSEPLYQQGSYKFKKDGSLTRGKGNWGHSGRKGKVGGSSSK